MSVWVGIIIGIVCINLGILIGAAIRKRTDLNREAAGILIIDRQDEGAGGVYSQFYRDPRTFTDGQFVVMQAMVLNLGEPGKEWRRIGFPQSQQKQR